jgi:acyl-CoA dehydrogenase
MEYARQRHTFGKPLVQHQVIRHKLVDMAQRVAASQAMLEMLAWRLDQGESPVAEICMLKNQATQTMAFCASEAVQIFGGAGYMRGIKVERIYREVKVNAIGGGSEEIMKDRATPPSPESITPAGSMDSGPAHPGRLLPTWTMILPNSGKPECGRRIPE